MVEAAPGGEMGHVSFEEPRARGAGGWILVLGAEGGVTDQLCTELEATGCDVTRRPLTASLDETGAPPDLVAIVATSSEDIDRLSRTVASCFPKTRTLGFLDGRDGSNGLSRGRFTGRVIDVAALASRPLASVVQLVLDGEVLASRLVRLTAEMDAILEARERAHAGLEENAQLIRSAASGLLAALKMMRWGAADVARSQPALLDSMRVSVESLLQIADQLPSHAGEVLPVVALPAPLHSRR